jgi:hypothetical protein
MPSGITFGIATSTTHVVRRVTEPALGAGIANLARNGVFPLGDACGLVILAAPGPDLFGFP